MQRERYDHSRAFFGLPEAAHRWRWKAVTDMSEVKAKDGKLYVSAIFDCFDLMPLGIAIEDNMRASLCCHTLENANKTYPDIKGCIIHSDRGSQYTSEEYRAAVKKYGIIQSMNSAGGRCHDNARCESMWGICTANGGRRLRISLDTYDIAPAAEQSQTQE